MMRVSILLIILSLLTSVSFAQNLTWNDLVAKPELRPTQCTVKKGAEFQSGLSVKAGQKMNILEFNSAEIVLGSLDGKIAYGASPKDTDVVEVANAAYSALTPEQRALTVAEILKRPELWPYKLTLKDSFDIGNQRLNKGDTVYLMTVKNGELVVVPPTFNLNFELQPADTDILEQARQYLVTPNRGRLVEELSGKLVNAATGQAVSLDAKPLPKYFVLYTAARWCPYTQQYTPGLLQAYKELKATHPNDFEVIYLPVEKSAGELQMYAKEMNFPWPALTYQQRNNLAVIAGITGRSSVPEIEVVDRYGNIIIDNTVLDREQVLEQFKALIKK